MLKKLLHPALIIPVNAKWQPQALGAGTVVKIMMVPLIKKENPLKIRDEFYVEWVDSVGRQSHGWLARTTAMNAPGITRKLHYVARALEDRLPAFDVVREMAMKSHRTLKSWLERSGKKYPDQLRSVVRELGGKTKPTDDGTELAMRIGRMVFKEELNMARNKGRKVAEEVADEDEELDDEVEDEGGDEGEDEGDEDEDEDAEDEDEEEETPRKSKKSKKSAKKSAKGKKSAEDEAPARSAARTTGEALLELVKGKKDLTRAAKALIADEKMSKKQLIQLRDDINEFAAKLREDGKNKDASKLSAVNRQVRRLSRQA